MDEVVNNQGLISAESNDTADDFANIEPPSSTEEGEGLVLDTPSSSSKENSASDEAFEQSTRNDLSQEAGHDESSKGGINIIDLLNQNYLYILVILFLMVLIGLLIVTSLLTKEVRWRKRRENSESIIFPDAHLDVLEGLKAAWEDLYNQLRDFTNLGLTNQKENENLSNKTLDSISKFNSTIEAQQQEINRLKEGYDYSIKKHSISALIDINELVENLLQEEISEESHQKLSKIDAYLKSYLDEFDVEKFGFEPGTNTRDLSPDDFEIDSAELTEDENLHGTVSKVLKYGYAFVHENGKKVIKKAKLKVFKKGENNE